MGGTLGFPYLASTPPPSFDYEEQIRLSPNISSVVLDPDTPVHGETHTRRHPKALHALLDCAYSEEGPGLRDLWSTFQRGVRVASSKPCMGTRAFTLDTDGSSLAMKDDLPVRGDYVWSTYAEVDVECREVGLGLARLGYAPHSCIGLMAKNRQEWLCAMLGAFSRSMRVSALYETLGPRAVQYILQHSDIECVFVSRDNLPAIIGLIDSVQLRHIVQFDPRERWANVHEAVSAEQVQRCAEKGVTLMSYSALLELARQDGEPVAPALPGPDDIAYIMYTSGTTGGLPHLHSLARKGRACPSPTTPRTR